MSATTVMSVAEASPAARAGIAIGDELVAVNGRVPKDVIEYQQLTDEAELSVLVRRSGRPLDRLLRITKDAGEPLGLAVSSAVFDRVRTCDNHCAFCFIHQLPKGMRHSLYLKDDDYRLSFLYGNFTTLTRFNELDAERVLDERLGPLFVSIHATDPELRARMLRNPRGATSLRWLRVLLDGGIEVHGQVVICPGVNDGPALEGTLADVLDRYPELASVGVVPLGISRFSKDPEMRRHTIDEADAVCEAVERWQGVFSAVLGRRMVFAADEYALLADRAFPEVSSYEGFPQHENGIGMVAAFEAAFSGTGPASGVKPGFFAWVDGAPPAGYRAKRVCGATAVGATVIGATAVDSTAVGVDDGTPRDRPERQGCGDDRPVTVLTGAYGARVLSPLLERHGFGDVEVAAIENAFFGGNIAVAGLLTGADVSRALVERGPGHRYLLPDACLSEDRFLDGVRVDELLYPVEVLGSDGASLQRALAGRR